MVEGAHLGAVVCARADLASRSAGPAEDTPAGRSGVVVNAGAHAQRLGVGGLRVVGGGADQIGLAAVAPRRVRAVQRQRAEAHAARLAALGARRGPA